MDNDEDEVKVDEKNREVCEEFNSAVSNRPRKAWLSMVDLRGSGDRGKARIGPSCLPWRWASLNTKRGNQAVPSHGPHL